MLIPISVYIWGIGGFLGSLQPGLNLRVFFAHVGVGFVMYRLMSTVIIDASTAFASHRPYIYDGNTRLTDYVLRTIGRSVYHFLLVQPLMIAVVIASPEFQWDTAALSLAGIALTLINLFLYGTVVALLGARFPDMGEFMGSAMLAGFLITPIVWYAELAPVGTTRGILMRANPLHHLLALVRDPLLGRAIEPVTWIYVAAMSAVGLVLAAFVYRAYARRVALWL